MYQRYSRKCLLVTALIMCGMLNACGNENTVPTEVESQTESVATEQTISNEMTVTIEDEETVTEEAEVVAEETDTEAPVITGVQEITAYLGDSISYKKGISVTDNSDETVELKIDTSAVDVSTIGDYPVVYSASDSAGNMTSVDAVLHIIEQPGIGESDVAPLADAVISKVTTPEMSNWDKAYALWNWCRQNVKYSYSAGNRTSVWTGAYEGLHDRTGDCYTFYATYEVLLKRVGIETMKVSRIDDESNHWWNLVNLGDGWYHCDTSPRRIGHTYKCFMQTDEQIQQYTDFYTEKPNYYTFDTTLYPERGTVIVYDGWAQ